ncbi:MAG: polysaccharide deacetylase family protein [Acidobacteriia bacterium]|nr:polysaccharide deacetylase family protein [Terriglobia bacterium]
MLIALYITGALIVGTVLVCLYASFSIRSSLFGKIYWRGRTDRHQVALTFDDGPHPRFTREILKILDDEKVPATFFLVGKKVEAFPDVAREILAADHELAFHGYTHRPLWLKPRRVLLDEIERSQAAFQKVCSMEPHLFRPPYGIRGRRIMKLATKREWKTIFWTRAGWDWTDIPGEEVARRALRRVMPGNILLLHDSDGPALEADRQRTVDALRIIIRELKDRGFSFARVTEILPE